MKRIRGTGDSWVFDLSTWVDGNPFIKMGNFNDWGRGWVFHYREKPESLLDTFDYK